MCAGFAASRAPQTVQQRVSLVRASVTRCSAAWSMAPAATTYSSYRIRRTCQRTKQQNSQAETTNKRIKGQTNLPTEKGEREKVQVAGVCVYCWVDSPQPSLVTSVSSREATPTRTKRKRRQRQTAENFVFLWCGRSRSEARSLHEKKL